METGKWKLHVLNALVSASMFLIILTNKLNCEGGKVEEVSRQRAAIISEPNRSPEGWTILYCHQDDEMHHAAKSLPRCIGATVKEGDI